MVALLGFDGASPFSLSAAKNAGGIVATTYLVGNPGGYPPASAQRVAQIRAAGMGALPNWERAADFFNTCTIADAKGAGAEALAACRALGYPDDGSVACAFSFDYQVPASGYAAARDKLLYAGEGLAGAFRPIAYGQYGLLQYLAGRGAAGPHWLSESTFNLDYVPTASCVAMVQNHDAAGNWLDSPVPGTDVNTVTNPHGLHAWWPANSPYIQPPTPPPPDYKEAHMFLYTIDAATAPKNWGDGIWLKTESGIEPVEPSQGKTSNVDAIQASLGQPAVHAVTYKQHQAWGGK